MWSVLLPSPAGVSLRPFSSLGEEGCTSAHCSLRCSSSPISVSIVIINNSVFALAWLVGNCFFCSINGFKGWALLDVPAPYWPCHTGFWYANCEVPGEFQMCLHNNQFPVCGLVLFNGVHARVPMLPLLCCLGSPLYLWKMSREPSSKQIPFSSPSGCCSHCLGGTWDVCRAAEAETKALESEPSPNWLSSV